MSTPYFYIIKNITTGKYYAGAQWKNNCSPDDLFVTYFTSSNTIKNLIEKYGIEDFTIECIISDFSKFELEQFIKDNQELQNCNISYIYETKFLRENRCAQSDIWLNSHNNFKNMPGFESDNSKNKSLEKYGTEYPIQSKEIQDKIKIINLQKYGVEYPSQLPQIQEKIKSTNRERYGVDYAIQSNEIREKIKLTMLEKYGVETPLQSTEIIEKMICRLQELYGVTNISKLNSIKKKKELTSINNYGTAYYIQSDEGKDNYKKTCLEKYGVDNVFKSEEIKNKISEECKEKYGVSHHSSRDDIRTKISEALTGRKLSETHIEKLKESKKGTVIVKHILTGEIKKITKEEFDNNRDTYAGVTVGMIPVKNKNGEIFMVDKNDPRYIEGELVHISKGNKNTSCVGMVNAVCSITGEKLGKIHKDDPRWKTGEIVHPSKGKSNTLAKGTKWVCHPEHPSIQVHPDEIQKYLDLGYQLGRKLK